MKNLDICCYCIKSPLYQVSLCISFICKDCKIEYDNGTLPRCKECDRLMRNKSFCYCYKEKKKQIQSLTESELISWSFSSRLEKRTSKLEKELMTTKEELTLFLVC